MLSTKQKNLIEYMIAHPEKSARDCYTACDVPAATYYKWKKTNPGFVEELDRRIKEVWKDSERLAVEKMIELAKEGCFQANKYILDNLGYKPVDKVEAEINSTISITIGDDEGEEEND